MQVGLRSSTRHSREARATPRRRLSTPGLPGQPKSGCRGLRAAWPCCQGSRLPSGLRGPSKVMADLSCRVAAGDEEATTISVPAAETVTVPGTALLVQSPLLRRAPTSVSPLPAPMGRQAGRRSSAEQRRVGARSHITEVERWKSGSLRSRASARSDRGPGSNHKSPSDQPQVATDQTCSSRLRCLGCKGSRVHRWRRRR